MSDLIRANGRTVSFRYDDERVIGTVVEVDGARVMVKPIDPAAGVRNFYVGWDGKRISDLTVYDK